MAKIVATDPGSPLIRNFYGRGCTFDNTTKEKFQRIERNSNF